MLEFIFGIIIGQLYLTNKLNPRMGVWLILFGFILLMPSVWVQHAITNRVIYWGIPSILIVMGAAMTKQVSHNILVSLGSASYSIYLIQVFTIPAFFKLLVIANSAANFQLINHLLAIILCIIVTILTGYLVHIYIELKLANLFKRFK